MTIDKIIEGLQIIAAHMKEPRDAYCVSAEHDSITVHAFDVRPGTKDADKMFDAGWSYDAGGGWWYAFV